jgi:hypothetical protein
VLTSKRLASNHNFIAPILKWTLTLWFGEASVPTSLTQFRIRCSLVFIFKSLLQSLVQLIWKCKTSLSLFLKLKVTWSLLQCSYTISTQVLCKPTTLKVSFPSVTDLVDLAMHTAKVIGMFLWMFICLKRCLKSVQEACFCNPASKAALQTRCLLYMSSWGVTTRSLHYSCT